MLLGGVSAAASGEPVDLGRRQERCLLGLLLLETGRPVPTDRLADLLWDGAPPEGARGVLQTYIARIRRRLATHGAGITRVANGYQIDAPPDTIDVHRFRALVAQARGASDPEAKTRYLDPALALWRGPLFGNDASDALGNGSARPTTSCGSAPGAVRRRPARTRPHRPRDRRARRHDPPVADPGTADRPPRQRVRPGRPDRRGTRRIPLGPREADLGTRPRTGCVPAPPA